jgi:predicted NUDIX family phosphoesterase
MTAAGNLRVSTYETTNRNHGSLIYKISEKDPEIVQLIPEFIWKKQQKVYIIKRIKKAQEMHLELLILSMK